MMELGNSVVSTSRAASLTQESLLLYHHEDCPDIFTQTWRQRFDLAIDFDAVDTPNQSPFPVPLLTSTDNEREPFRSRSA